MQYMDDYTYDFSIPEFAVMDHILHGSMGQVDNITPYSAVIANVCFDDAVLTITSRVCRVLIQYAMNRHRWRLCIFSDYAYSMELHDDRRSQLLYDLGLP